MTSIQVGFSAPVQRENRVLRRVAVGGSRWTAPDLAMRSRRSFEV
ncbi:MAG: hypothetical protein ABI706_17115 [Ilumatobacteraceae bacterium]